MLNGKFKGVVVPSVTPLTPDERVDTASLRRLVNYLIDEGAHGIWAAGTTGEFAALRDDQRLLAIEKTAEEVNGRVPVIGNVSGAGTQATIDMARALAESGLDGIAATPPYYYLYDQGEIADHFRAISDAVSQPLWVYNIPITVKLTVEPATIADLAAEGTVVGVKDSSGQGEAFAELVTRCRRNGAEMYRFLGSVYRTTMTKCLGAHGTIPGGGNIAAGALSRAWEAGEAGDTEAANEHLERALSAQRVMGLAKAGGRNAATSSGLKSSLKLLGIIDHDTVSAPMRSLTEEEKAQIPGILREAGLLS